ncbi:MAG TPA: phage holin family protein [Pseudonocardiaceae bacterium]
MTSQHNHNGGERGGRPAAGLPPVPSIPLSDERLAGGAHISGGSPNGQSIGGLVREATIHLSTLIRSEVELAKIEIAAEVKKGLRGSVYFILALSVLIFGSFFFFFALAELLADLGLYRSAAFGIVFLLMLLTAALFALLGYRRVRTLRKPERTINAVRDTASTLAHLGHGNGQHDSRDTDRPSHRPVA